MPISIRTLEGRTIALEARPNDKVLKAKREVQKKVGIRIDLQRLMFANQPLENNRLLSSYGIVDDSILYLVLRSAESSKTVAGGYGIGDDDNELCFPYGVVFDGDQTMIIADWGNHRIVRWKLGDDNGKKIAGGNGQGSAGNQLSCPTDLLLDKESNSLIICDHGNRRIVRWSRNDGATEGEILLENIACWGVAMDDQRCLYISDVEKDKVIRYHIEDKNVAVVAGGNGRGAGFNQLNRPTSIFVDDQRNVYVSDTWNYRVMKWNKDAKEGILVVRGFPRGLFVDASETIYVADYGSHRLMRWPKGATEGTVIAGGIPGRHDENQLYHPWGLSSDQQGNLYVADHLNHRVQRFPMKQSDEQP